MNEDRWLNQILPRVQDHSRAVAYDTFVNFLNPKYRGPNWKWSFFREYTIRQVKISVYQSFSDEEWGIFESQILETAEHNARFWAEEILKDSGILEWWPNAEGVP